MNSISSRADAFLATRLSNASDVSYDPDSPNTPTGVTHDLLVGGMVLATIENKVDTISKGAFVTDSDLFTLQFLNEGLSSLTASLWEGNPKYKGLLVDFSAIRWDRYVIQNDDALHAKTGAL